MAVHRADFATWHGLLAVLALGGAVLLVAAELSPLYTVVVGALGTPRRSVSGGSSHRYALLAVAVVAVVMAYGALRGSRAAAGAVAVLGAVALVVALAIDAPDTRRTSTLPEAVAYADARAHAGRGFGLEIAGGAVLVAAGGLMLALGPLSARLSSRPGAPPARGPRARSPRP